MEPGRSGVYLEQEVYSATPAKLRWMLIDHAEQMCGRIAHLWEREEIDQAVQWQIQVRDILAELLSGVQASGGQLSETVADLYVFLLAYFTVAEQARDLNRLNEVRRVLRIENETWKKFCEQELRQNNPSTASAISQIVPTQTGSSQPYTGLNLSV